MSGILFTIRVIFKGIWRDMIEFSRYKANLYGWFLDAASMVFGFLAISGSYEFAPAVFNLLGLSNNDVFLFMMTGMTLQTFAGIATWAPMFRVQDDIHFGTLEAVFVTPASRLGYLLSTTISKAITSLIFFAPIYFITLLVAGALTSFKVIALSFLIVVITIISMISVGLFFGMLAVLFRQTTTLASVIHIVIQYICGAFIPVQGFVTIHPVIGSILQYIAMLFPFTYCFDLMRYCVFGSRYIPLLPIWQEFVIIFAATVFYVFLARISLISVEKSAKKKGLSLL